MSRGREARTLPARRLLLRRLLAAGGGGLAALLLAELALRLFAPQPASWLDVYRRHPRLPLFALQPNVSRVVDTGETRWTVFTDADGFRVNSARAASNSLPARTPLSGTPPPGTPLADPRPVDLWLGDSFAFAHGVDHELGWIGRLAAQAEAGAPADLAAPRVVNAAVPGYGPVQQLAVLDDLLAMGLRPARVMLATYVGNDFHDCVWGKDLPVREGVLGDEGGPKSWVKRHLHLYRLLARAAHRAGLGRDEGRGALLDALYDAQAWQSGLLAEARLRYREALAGIAQRCAQLGVPCLAVVIPTAGAVESLTPDGLAEHAVPADIADITEQVARAADGSADPGLPVRQALDALQAAGIPALDLRPVLAGLPREERYFAFDGHFTPQAHALVAAAVSAALAR